MTSSHCYKLTPHVHNVVRASSKLRKLPPDTHDIDDELMRRRMFDFENADEAEVEHLLNERVHQLCKWMWSVNAYTEYTQLKVSNSFKLTVNTLVLLSSEQVKTDLYKQTPVFSAASNICGV